MALEMLPNFQSSVTETGYLNYLSYDYRQKTFIGCLLQKVLRPNDNGGKTICNIVKWFIYPNPPQTDIDLLRTNFMENGYFDPLTGNFRLIITEKKFLRIQGQIDIEPLTVDVEYEPTTTTDGQTNYQMKLNDLHWNEIKWYVVVNGISLKNVKN